MIITIDKGILTQNIIYQVEKTIDLLKDNNYKPLYLTTLYQDWIERQIAYINFDIQKLLTPITKHHDEDEELLYYDVEIKHPLQQRILPQLIDETLTYYVAEMWCNNNNIPFVSRTAMNRDEIKSLALKTATPPTRKYRIIY